MPGIGTDASIPSHINNICTRNYVTIGTGRTLVPTSLGILLVHGYHKIDPDLVLPKVLRNPGALHGALPRFALDTRHAGCRGQIRASIEKQCALVAEGKASKEHVVAHSLEIFAAKFKYFVSRIGDMDSLFEVTFSKLEDTGKFLSKCGKCRRYMKYVPLRPQRLFCPTCNVTYSLPQNGTIKLYKEVRGAGLVLCSGPPASRPSWCHPRPRRSPARWTTSSWCCTRWETLGECRASRRRCVRIATTIRRSRG